MKSVRRKISSMTYGQASRLKAPVKGRFRIPGLGEVRCSKNELLEGTIVGGRFTKRASGFYFQFVIKPSRVEAPPKTGKACGMDPGFGSLLAICDTAGGKKRIGNPDEYRKGEERLARAQRGKNKKLVARLHEKIKNRKKDRNHQISREIVNEYDEIYVGDDNFKAMQALFGKSINNACLGELLLMIAYKCLAGGKKFKRVTSKYSTQDCSVCGCRTGPKGLRDLGVRKWLCSVCRTLHDRDFNAAMNELLSGLGIRPPARKSNSPRQDVGE